MSTEVTTQPESLSEADSARLFTSDEVAAILRITPAAMKVMRCRGKGPEFFRIGRRVRYFGHSILRWLASKRV